MPRKPIKFNLDFMRKDIFSRFTVKQFDDVTFTITPLINNEPYNISNMTGKIYVGVNNEMYLQDTNITVSSNSIVVTLDKNMLNKDGRVYAEIELTDSIGTVTSSSFIFDIDRKIGEGANIPGQIDGFVAKYEKLTTEFKQQFQDSLNDVDNRFNILTSSQQQDSEVILARKGETSLKVKIDKIDEQFISIMSKNATKVEVDVERKRIDIFTKLAEGSTTSDAELIDGRIDNNSIIHENVGNNIRFQGNRISDINNTIETINWIDNHFLDVAGNELTGDETRSCTDFMMCDEGIEIEFISEANNQHVNAISFYNKDKIYISGVANVGSATEKHQALSPLGTYYARLSILKKNKNISLLNRKNLVRNYIKKINEKIDIIKNNNKSLDVLKIDFTNYFVIIDKFYDNFQYNESGKIVSANGICTTDLVDLDFNYNMYSGNMYTTKAVFFDENNEFIAYKEFYYNSSLLKENYPQNAKKVGFSYYKEGILADKMYISKIDNTFCHRAYSNILKINNIRPVINIYLNDSEETIFLKLCDAWYTQDCDVYFEHGTYNLDTIFSLMVSKYEWNTALELPIGANCRYFLNNSTIIANPIDLPIADRQNSNIFGSHRLSGSYELHDGTLIANNICYCVHDEASGLPEPYLRKYANIDMKYISGDATQQICKCLGGGTGLNGMSIIENCAFDSDNGENPVASYHGRYYDNESVSIFNLVVTNSYFKNKLSLDGLGEKETANLRFVGNSVKELPVNEKWNVISYNNEVRV